MPPRKALWALYPSYNNLYRDEATTSMTAEIDMLVAQMEKVSCTNGKINHQTPLYTRTRRQIK